MLGHDAVTLIKEFNYRGSLEEWSNTYLLDGVTPTTPAEWKTLFDAIAASEKTCFRSTSYVVRAYGYTDASELAVASYDYKANNATIPGTAPYVQASHDKWAGDQAGWLRMRVGTNVKGKPVYLRKYFHDGFSSAANADQLDPDIKTKYVAHGNKMVDGTLPGGMKWIAKGGTVGTLPVAGPYVTTRTLKRRGRRPT